MSTQEYCRQRAAPPGSNFYYSTLYHPDPIRRRLFALHALEAEISHIIEEVSDPGVARVKLAWWHDEIQRLFAGHARHPVSQELHTSAGYSPIPESQLQELVTHTEQRLVARQPSSYTALLDFLRKGPGLLWRLSANLCGYQSPATPTLCSEIGCSLALFEYLQCVRKDIAGGSLLLPADELAVAGLTANALFETERENVRDFFALQVNRVQMCLEEFSKQLPAPDRRRQLHALIMTRIVMQTCKEIAREGYRLPQHRVALTPLRKLWIAWRVNMRTE